MIKHPEFSNPSTVQAPKSQLQNSFSGWSPLAFSARYNNGRWGVEGLLEGNQLSIDVSASGLQFGQSVFEGCIASRNRRTDLGAKIQLFRPQSYYSRLVNSCNRVCIPPPSERFFIEALSVIAQEGSQWEQPFSSDLLYMRPLLFGSDGGIMPGTATEYRFVVLCAPFVRPFKSEGQNLVTEPHYSRTAPNGLGSAKTGANYAHSHLPTRAAHENLYDSILWLDSTSRSLIEEANVANIFFETKSSIITPRSSGNFLRGVTRDSVICLLKTEYNAAVHEVDISVDEIFDMYNNGNLLSIFCTGTAVGIQPVKSLTHGTATLVIENESLLVQKIRSRLLAIQHGKESESNGWMHSIT
ncbi:aminotransferase class IV [Marinobacter lacisalsi]|uniref:Aminotransferase class IV n=1 Tax=Marinobacter lacisalsi TaxID=475979 RepID=A0ABV8QDS9_9GAMM